MCEALGGLNTRSLDSLRRVSAPPPSLGMTKDWGFHSSVAVVVALFLLPLLSCSSRPDPDTLVMIIESSPANLDPRVGLDAQSERIDSLIFDNLLTRDDHLNVQPGLAERW